MNRLKKKSQGSQKVLWDREKQKHHIAKHTECNENSAHVEMHSYKCLH